ncbi:DUF2961 domain-containing protein [Rathayibacter tritici]|uniref:DUF2961 domain-containing protein n=1 Tax=Rathayibacter tritici TaxID=33888 RepID=UPI000B0D7929|nr:DUF2961 domain-containing protein [Rathayibacter tritici]
MPFGSRARQNDIPYLQYFYIDYELSPEPLPEDTVYFHALAASAPQRWLGS